MKNISYIIQQGSNTPHPNRGNKKSRENKDFNLQTHKTPSRTKKIVFFSFLISSFLFSGVFCALSSIVCVSSTQINGNMSLNRPCKGIENFFLAFVSVCVCSMRVMNVTHITSLNFYL